MYLEREKHFKSVSLSEVSCESKSLASAAGFEHRQIEQRREIRDFEKRLYEVIAQLLDAEQLPLLLRR